ncbi:MAG TPA: FAD:protein FMN transferase [Porphyromonadaceae bacterium]|nr:FAD:protein FMN transferase [Porphyromonadaceae bacterium]
MISSYSHYYESSETFHGSLQGIMGTRFDVVMTGCDELKGQSVWDIIVLELKRLDGMLNRFDPKSELSRLNQQAVGNPVSVSPEMWTVLTGCKRYHALTLGLFDITLKDFSLVSFDEISHSILLPSEKFAFDLGGYAKGYAMEKMKTILRENAIENAFIDFGNSSIVGLGHHPYGDCWKVSIENPFRKEEILGEVSLINQDISTSGNTPLYSNHIIHPFTGEYSDAKKLVSVVANNSIQAEVLTTTLMIATNEQKEAITPAFDIEKITSYDIQ